jgi:hypothetical protein
MENICYNLIFASKFNDSSVLITIILRDYLNLSLANEHIGDVTIPTQVIKYQVSNRIDNFHNTSIVIELAPTVIIHVLIILTLSNLM